MRFSVCDVDNLEKLRKVSWLDRPVDHNLAYITGTRNRSSSCSPIRRIEERVFTTDQDVLRSGHLSSTMHAPFGTEQTPPLKVKIIGGRYVTVLEKPPVSARKDVESLTRSVGKPNVQLDMREWSEKFHKIVTPREQQVVRHELTKSPPLPPIPHGSHDDFAQTHPDVMRMHAPDKMVAMKDFAHTLPAAGVSTHRGHHLPLPPISAGEGARDSVRHQSAEQVANTLLDLYDVLPKDKYLPHQPIQIDAAHYVALLSELERELGHLNPIIWQQIYIELTTFDRRLAGDVKFNDLCLVLVRNGVFLPPQLLRFLGALFVATGEGSGRVNYEKIVSFLSACMKYFGDKQQRSLIINGADLPEPPFELLGSMETAESRYPPHASHAAQTNLEDSGIGLGNSGRLPHPHGVGVQVWDLIGKDFSEQPHEMHDEELPHSHHQPHPHHLPPPHHPHPIEPAHSLRLPEPEEMEERLREKFLEQEKHRELLESGMLKPPQEDAEYSRYRQLAMDQILRTRQHFDSESLRLHFQRADRNMRGTLSVGQVVDVCKAAHIPLEPKLVVDIVRNLCTHRGGGQYDWQEFQAFIDKLKPQQTGLNVGFHNYARVYAQPEPLPSWPLPDPGSVPRLAHPENRGADQEAPKYYHATSQDASSRHPHPPPHQHPHADGSNGTIQHSIRGIKDEIQKIEERLSESARQSKMDALRKALEHEHPQHYSIPDFAARTKLNPTDGVSGLLEHFQLTPRSKNNKWMERFMQLAAAVYENVDSQGFLKAPMARHATKKQADTLRLMIADIDIEDALRFSRTVDGRIDTQLFLKRLCRNKLTA